MHNLTGKSDRSTGYFCRDIHICLKIIFLVFRMVQEILSSYSLFALLIIFDEFCAIYDKNINPLAPEIF
jgi:hypothetical protein